MSEKNDPDGLQQHHQILPDRPVPYVLRVQLGPFAVAGVVPAGYLPQPGKAGQHLWLLNLTTANLTIKHELGGETAANKITTLTGSDVVTTANGAAHFIYDGTTTKWICVSASL